MSLVMHELQRTYRVVGRIQGSPHTWNEQSPPVYLSRSPDILRGQFQREIWVVLCHLTFLTDNRRSFLAVVRHHVTRVREAFGNIQVILGHLKCEICFVIGATSSWIVVVNNRLTANFLRSGELNHLLICCVKLISVTCDVTFSQFFFLASSYRDKRTFESVICNVAFPCSCQTQNGIQVRQAAAAKNKRQTEIG